MFILVVTLTISSRVTAQVNLAPIFTQIKLEARADVDYIHTTDNIDTNSFPDLYGLHGRYFNLVIGGPLGDKFSYYFRQRIIANPGNVSLFDNTDFLYVNYMPSKNWMVRLGKDALAVGGIEYDATPINVLFNTVYWNNFYCFQPAVSGAYISDDGKQTFLIQVANSPYVYYGAHYDYGIGSGLGNEWTSGLLAYSLYWNGNFGPLRVLHSINMFKRADGNYMNYIALGHELNYEHWDIYLDLIHHANGWKDWGRNFAVVSCANLYFDRSKGFSCFVKGSYEQNFSNETVPNFHSNTDIFVEAGHSYLTYGGGVEYYPPVCPSLRIHAFIANRRNMWSENGSNIFKNELTCNLGVTWTMDIHKMFKDRASKN